MKPTDVLLALAVPVIWGMGLVIAKAGMDHFPPILLMALRFTITSICLVGFFRPPKGLLISLFWVALISASLQYSLTFTGLNGIDASTAALVVQLEVPFGVLMSYFVFRDRVNLWQIFGMVIAFTGTIMIAGEPKLANNLMPLMLVIAGALTWSVGQIMLKRLGDIGGFKVITWVAIFATPQLYLASYIIESDQIEAIRSATVNAWLAVLYLGIVMTAVGYGIWYGLLGKYPVSRVMPFLLLLPVVSVLGGILFLDEYLTEKIMTGGILSLLGVAVITLMAPSRTKER